MKMALERLEQKFDSNSVKAIGIIDALGESTIKNQLKCYINGMTEAFVELIDKSNLFEKSSMILKKNTECTKEILISDDDILLKCRQLTTQAKCQQLRKENFQLQKEIFLLTSELEALRLKARYLDRERAGRIQQMQLLISKEGNKLLPPLEWNRVWEQIQSEISLHQSKSVVAKLLLDTNKLSRSQREQVAGGYNEQLIVALPAVNQLRHITVACSEKQLGFSITGGQKQGVPIIVAIVEKTSKFYGHIFSGDVIIMANGKDLSSLTLLEATTAILDSSNKAVNNIELIVRYIGSEDDDIDELDCTALKVKKNSSVVEKEYQFLKNIENEKIDDEEECLLHPVELPSFSKTSTAQFFAPKLWQAFVFCGSVTDNDYDYTIMTDPSNPFSDCYNNSSTAKMNGGFSTKRATIQPCNNGSSSSNKNNDVITSIQPQNEIDLERKGADTTTTAKDSEITLVKNAFSPDI